MNLPLSVKWCTEWHAPSPLELPIFGTHPKITWTSSQSDKSLGRFWCVCARSWHLSLTDVTKPSRGVDTTGALSSIIIKPENMKYWVNWKLLSTCTWTFSLLCCCIWASVDCTFHTLVYVFLGTHINHIVSWGGLCLTFFKFDLSVGRQPIITSKFSWKGSNYFKALSVQVLSF